jgi:hypothetical protein
LSSETPGQTPVAVAAHLSRLRDPETPERPGR